MQAVKQTFSDATEVLDGNQYTECTFNRCKLVYRGGDIPLIKGCQFNQCNWQFEESAERTLVFMRLMYHGMGTGGSEIIEAAFNTIRQPIPGA